MKKKRTYFAFLPIVIIFASCETTKLEIQPTETISNVKESVIKDEKISTTNKTNEVKPLEDDVPVTIIEEELVEPVQLDIINTDDTIFSNEYSPSIIKTDEPLKIDTSKIDDDIYEIEKEPSINFDETIYILPLDSNEKTSNKSKNLLVLEEEPIKETQNNLDSTTVAAIYITQYLEAIKGEGFEVLIEGKKWIYLGEKETKESFTSYNKREYNNQDTIFKFKALKEGIVILHFYKQDLINNENLEEYVQVKISNPIIPEETNVITIRTDLQESNINLINDEPLLTYEVNNLESSEISDDSINTNLKTADELYTAAKKSFDDGQYQNCIAYLDQFFITAVSDIDKGWFLKGQTYEKKSEIKDIKKALESYKTLVDSYPESSLWEQSENRIKYINRYYYNIH